MSDDARELENAVIAGLEPYRELLARMMGHIERLTDRIEALERAALPIRESDTRQLGGDLMR